MPTYTNPVAEFARRVRELTAGGMSPEKAKIAVARADRVLHEAVLIATNASRTARQAIRDAFATQATGVR